MFWSAKAKREKFVKRAEDLGGSIQLSFYEAAKKFLELKYDDKTSVKLAAALANYVFHFGLVAPIHTDDKSLMAILLKEKSSCLSSLGDIFKTNATGVLILLGAAWQVDLEKYKAHMRELASYGFVKTGKQGPNVGRELPESDLVYMYCIVGEEF
jgi:hypothetical protein